MAIAGTAHGAPAAASSWDQARAAPMCAANEVPTNAVGRSVPFDGLLATNGTPATERTVAANGTPASDLTVAANRAPGFDALLAANGAPGSRDELFGDAPAKPDNGDAREKLFGDQPAPRSGPSWRGFVRGELAYTYAQPAHWSKMLVRGELDGEGALTDTIKYHIGARLDYDFVYDATDFYPPDVRRDQRVDFLLRENYLDIGAGDWDFRLGRQHVVWGEMVGLFFADVVSAKDLREFILPDFNIVRIPQWAARAEYFKDDFHAEFVWIPVATYNEIGVPGSEFYTAPLAPPPGFATEVVDERTPNRNLSHTNYGLRLSLLRGGWDVAGFYYGSMDQSPTFYRTVASLPQPTFVYEPRHERINQGGFTVAKDFGVTLFKAEAVYTTGRKYNINDLADADGVVPQKTIDWAAGTDFTLPVLSETRLNLQLVQRIYLDHDPRLSARKYETGYSVYASTLLDRGWEATLLWGSSFNRHDTMLRLALARNFQRNWRFAVGVDAFDGSPEGVFGQYRRNDRVYTQVTYSF